MKRVKWAIIATLSVFLSACSQYDMPDFASAESDYVKISAQIQPRNARATIANDGKGHFDNGDRIQLFVTPEYSTSPTLERQLTLEHDNWTPRISWQNDLSDIGSKATFSAFYPSLSYNREVNVSYDQHANGNQMFKTSDLLCAHTSVSRGEQVPLKFEHIMSCATVNLTSTYYSANDLAKAQVYVWGATKGRINATNGQCKPIYNNSVERQIRMAYMGNGVFRAILVPQEIMDEWKNNKPWITVFIEGEAHEIKAPATLNNGTPFNALEAGKEVTLNVSVNKEDITIWANQTKWVYGLHMPPFDDKDKWGYVFVKDEQKILGLTWDPSYGWFDCNKVDPVNPNHPAHDSNMCWAASCSNLIHWWLEQNADYVNRFGYNGPRKYPNSRESEIFQLYKDNFKNEGYFVPNGLNWFFTGRDGNTFKPNGGFFHKVFGESSVVRVADFGSADPTNRKRFADAMKQAFQNKEAIECSFILPIGSAHAITFWGADFDAEGYITNVYITENNDIDWELQEEKVEPGLDRKIIPGGLFKKPIQYRNGLVYMESAAAGKFTMKVEQLNFLGLHRDKWEAYFNNL